MCESNKVKNCKQCTFPCCKSGKDLKPINISDLEEFGYILCEDYTEIRIEEQDC